jgi:hypothetical protein
MASYLGKCIGLFTCDMMFHRRLLKLNKSGSYKGQSYPCNKCEGPLGCETSRLPHFLRQIGSQMAVRFSASRTGRPLRPGRFLVLISVTAWVDPKAIVRMEGFGQLNKSNDIGNRTRNTVWRSDFSTLPQHKPHLHLWCTKSLQIRLNNSVCTSSSTSWRPRVHVVSEKKVVLLWESYTTHKYTLWMEFCVCEC